MDTATVEREFREKVGAEIGLSKDGDGRLRVISPFTFGDGDHLVVHLASENGRWVFTDHGHTLMHLSYHVDDAELAGGPSSVIITRVLSAYSIEDRDGELVLPIKDGEYGRALYDYLQALFEIVSLVSMRQTRLQSALPAEVYRFIREELPPERVQMNWHDPARDPKAHYSAPYRVDGVRQPTFLFVLPSDEAVREATITLHQFEKWGLHLSSIGVFEAEENIDRKVLARFGDVCDKLFSNLPANRDRLVTYLREALGEEAA